MQVWYNVQIHTGDELIKHNWEMDLQDIKIKKPQSALQQDKRGNSSTYIAHQITSEYYN
jgi:hypothetical protein